MPCSRSSRRLAVRAASSLAEPLFVSPGETKHPARGQAEVAEHRPKWLARIDRIQQLLTHLNWQQHVRPGVSPGSLSVAVRPLAEGEWHLACQRAEVPCTASFMTGTLSGLSVRRAVI